MKQIIISLLFILLPLAQSTLFDLPGRAGTGENPGCCGDPNLIPFVTSFTFPFNDPAPAGPKVGNIVVSLNAHYCDYGVVVVCLNGGCNVPIGVSASCFDTTCGDSFTPIQQSFPATTLLVGASNSIEVRGTTEGACGGVRSFTDNTAVFFRIGIVTCGDGIVETGELCDNSTGCDPTTCACQAGYYQTEPNVCTRYCGDGLINNGELCEVDTPGCDPNTCTCKMGYRPFNETCELVCGNGVLDAGFEECDGGVGCEDCVCAANYTSMGTVDCFACGNGIFDLNEECDSGIGCTVNCTCVDSYVSVGRVDCSKCGNGVIDAGEDCESGGSGCGQDCKCLSQYAAANPPATDCLLKCGNGVLDDGERCDGGEGCNDSCQCGTDYVENIPPTKDCVSALVDPAADANAGAIAGGVVGSVLGAGLIALGVFFYLQRRKKKKAAKSKSSSDSDFAELGARPTQPERVQSSASLERSGAQLTTATNDSATENSGTNLEGSFLPTKSKTELEGSEDFL